jgi:hypothetical protein
VSGTEATLRATPLSVDGIGALSMPESASTGGSRTTSGGSASAGAVGLSPQRAGVPLGPAPELTPAASRPMAVPGLPPMNPAIPMSAQPTRRSGFVQPLAPKDEPDE